MTSYERVANTLNRKPVDQCPVVVGPWDETNKRWIQEGHYSPEQDVRELFGMDLRWVGGFDMAANLDYVPETVEETDETISVRDGNGAVLRTFKGKSGTPEHVDFRVRDRQGWDKFIKPFFSSVDKRRIPFEKYRAMKKYCAEKQLFLFWGGLDPFELMHPVCGHENLLMGMALDPDWIKDMVETYVNLTINHFEILFHEDGLPDGVWLSEDLGFKDHPFISPAMYKELLLDGHKKLFDFFHSKKLKVIVHSCGYVEPLVPGLIEAGMDCLQAMEVKAGMDMPRLFKNYGDKISFCGNIDVTIMLKNNIEELKNELEKKILPVIKGGGGYILHSDHSIPPQVDYETFRFFIENGRYTGEKR